MGLLDIFKKKENKNLGLLEPIMFLGVIDTSVVTEVDKIDWAQYATAYGNAEKTIPFYLKNIFCTDEQTALATTHQLWCSICHQGVNMADAALPAYEILKTGLLKLNDSVKLEILYIFAAFALCTSREYVTTPNELIEWEKEIQSKLLQDKDIFYDFEMSDNNCISSIAKLIRGYLENQKM